MAIHELGELTPITRRVRKLEAKAGKIGVASDGAIGAFLLAGDADETAVRVEIPSKSGGILFASCVVVHVGDAVLDVRLPDGFRALAVAAGVDSMAPCWEGYLETLARLAFARGER